MDYTKTRREYWKKRIDETFGVKCKICGHETGLCLHNIHGLKHSNSRKRILQHKRDYIRLCYKCHKAIHLLTYRKAVTPKILRTIQKLIRLVRPS